MRFAVTVALLAVLFGNFAPAGAHAQQTERVTFNIASQELRAALEQFAQQSRKDVLFSPEVVAAKRSTALAGTHEPDAALTLLLAGTGLYFRHADERTILVDARAQAETTTQPSEAHPSTAAEPVADYIEDVVVTARKTEESLQRVPISIIAIAGDDLSRRSLGDLSAVGQATPNFTFAQQAQGGRSAGVVYIRGVGQSDTLAAYDSAVGVYLDGVFLGRMQANDLDMMGIERLEILRGPQGTLFGRNTSGGAVNIITERPSVAADGLSGRIQGTTGSRDRLDVLGSLNIPLVPDEAALRIAASRREQGGFGRRVDGEDMGDINRKSGKVSLLLTPSPRFSALLSADVSSYDETNAVMKLIFVDPTVPPIAALNGATDEPFDTRWLSPGDFANYSTGPDSSRGEVWGSSLTLDFDAEWGDVKSISAYRAQETHNDLDTDLSPVTVVDYLNGVDQHQFSQELQVTGTVLADRLDWVLGAYYFKEGVVDRADVPVLIPLLGTAASFSQINDITNSSYAVYGQSSYDLTEVLRLTAGLRLTHDKKEVERGRAGFPSGVPIEPTVAKVASSDDVSPRIGIDYQWSPTVMTYASLAKGYKAGGFNGRANVLADFNEFDAEMVWTAELGLRSDLLERRLRLNATAFHSDYSDLQLQINGSTIVAGAPAPFTLVTNIPKARVIGGELELELIPATAVKLSAGLGITHARYTDLPDDEQFMAADLIDTDSRFVNSPKVSYTVGAQYARRIASLDVTGRLDYTHKSTIYYDVTNSPLVRQKPYGLLNARIELEHQSSGVLLALFGTNLTDEHYIIGGFNDVDRPNPGLGFAFTNMAAPREFGVSAQWRF